MILKNYRSSVIRPSQLVFLMMSFSGFLYYESPAQCWHQSLFFGNGLAQFQIQEYYDQKILIFFFLQIGKQVGQWARARHAFCQHSNCLADQSCCCSAGQRNRNMFTKPHWLIMHMREVQLASKHKLDWLLGSIKFKNNKKFG